VVQDQKHKSLLQFIRKVVDVAAGLSKEDLATFRSKALREYTSLVPLIDEYLRFAERADTDVLPLTPGGNSSRHPKTAEPVPAHLFDMLRDKRAFPSNSDLSDFAGRILPNMTRRRFDKMSRGEIVAKIIEYVETLDTKTRRDLESSIMKDAMTPGTNKSVDRRSFLSKWERIIKGIQL
jgi:hypothetical protein